MIEQLSLHNATEALKFVQARGITKEACLAALAGWRESLSEESWNFALSEMKRHLMSFAPQWLAEYANVDSALDLPQNCTFELQACNNLVQEKYDCTSWIVTPELTAAGKMLLHKNRDASETSHAPLFFRTPGKFAWMGSCSRNMPYPLMGINEKGLAVAMNSGELTERWNLSGFGTPMMARLVLENCTTPDEAARYVEELRRGGAYSHKSRGSIFFYANAEYAGLTEMCSERSQYINFDFGYMIRANAWHLPGMTAMSVSSSEIIMKRNLIREYMVRDGLLEYGSRGGMTPAGSLDICRRRGRMLAPDEAGVCRPTTTASGTFEIDGEFPELSTCYHLCGPARNTIAVPIFLGAGALPEKFVSTEWTSRAFKFKNSRGIDHVLTPAFEEVERELLKKHAAVADQARSLFSARRNTEAKALLQKFTCDAFEEASQAFTEITGF